MLSNPAVAAVLQGKAMLGSGGKQIAYSILFYSILYHYTIYGTWSYRQGLGFGEGRRAEASKDRGRCFCVCQAGLSIILHATMLYCKYFVVFYLTKLHFTIEHVIILCWFCYSILCIRC